jgi:hypothetical protein
LPRSAAVLQGFADPVDQKSDGKAGETPGTSSLSYFGRVPPVSGHFYLLMK